MTSFPATVFVTGATGFVGRTLVRRWVSTGRGPENLRCLVRDRERAIAAGLPETTLVDGDLADENAMRAAVAGCDAVVHLAGVLTALRPREFFAVNAIGTRDLVAAVAAEDPDMRFVHVSSLAAVGPSVDGSGTDVPPDRARPCSTYGESKRRGELAVVQGPLTHWIVLRPPAVYGSGDRATRLLFDQARAPLTVVPLGTRPLSIIHVDDLATAIERALVSDASKVFVPVEGPDRTDTADLVRRLGAACGRRPRLLPVPMGLARAAGTVADLVARLHRRSGFFNGDKMREVSGAGWVADGDVARRVLGFEPRVGLEEGLRAVADADGFAR